MIHQPLSSFIGTQTGEFFMESGRFTNLYDSLIEVYVQRTGKPKWIIITDINRDAFMSATEAKDYGIVDDVGLDLSGLY